MSCASVAYTSPVLAGCWAPRSPVSSRRGGHDVLHATAPVDAIVHCPAPVPPGRLTHRWLAASQRVRNARAEAELGWAPRFPTVREGVWTAGPR
jgi:hypothetical protein